MCSVISLVLFLRAQRLQLRLGQHCAEYLVDKESWTYMYKRNISQSTQTMTWGKYYFYKGTTSATAYTEQIWFLCCEMDLGKKKSQTSSVLLHCISYIALLVIFGWIMSCMTNVHFSFFLFLKGFCCLFFPFTSTVCNFSGVKIVTISDKKKT